MAEAWFIAGTVPFVLAGGGHLLGALLDTVRPTFFVPVDGSVLPVLQGTSVRLRRMFPGGNRSTPSLWRAWLGFNISHGLGAFAFGLVCLLVALDDSAHVVEVAAIRPAALIVSVTYFLVSLRYWFYGPAIATGIGTACFLVATFAA